MTKYHKTTISRRTLERLVDATTNKGYYRRARSKRVLGVTVCNDLVTLFPAPLRVVAKHLSLSATEELT
jgi:hypothetical protein